MELLLKKEARFIWFNIKFSFYYAHHMSTIEGGMICTNNKKIYQIARSLRSHGMLREIQSKTYEKNMIKKYKDLSPKFIFLYKGFNFRNNEIGAILGLNQLKRLNECIKRRNSNFIYFLKNLSKKYFLTDFNLEGISNYAFPLILKKKNFLLRDKLEKLWINIILNIDVEMQEVETNGDNHIFHQK